MFDELSASLDKGRFFFWNFIRSAKYGTESGRSYLDNANLETLEGIFEFLETKYVSIGI